MKVSRGILVALGGVFGYAFYCVLATIVTAFHFIKWGYVDPLEIAVNCVAPLVNPIS